jgi:hypothetical protein
MYGAGNYYIAFLGTPSVKGKFEVQFGGHHMAFANTYIDGKLAGATPSFRGVEPAGKFVWDKKTNQPMEQEQAALAGMLSSLSVNELRLAKLTGVYGDLVVGPQRDGSFPSVPSGLPCYKLSSDGKKLVMKAIATYVDDIASPEAFLAKYKKEFDSTYISYLGAVTLANRNDYVRIDGPSVWIEYSCQGGIVVRGNHPHSVWRDKLMDYGGNN